MLFSGVKNGLTDIYEYSIRSNVVSTIISDAYDNINPVYVNGDEIMFSSNRINDSIEFKLLSKQPFLDLFLYSPENKKISRLTKTTNTSEVGVKYLGNNNVAFLGVTDNKTTVFKANFDSTISHVDTIVHYRYYLNKNPITNYTKDIISFDLPIDQNQLVFSVFDKDKYWIYNKINPSVEDLNIKIEFPTKLADEKIQPKALIEKSYKIIEDPMLQNKGSSLDMQNFRFLINDEVENPTSLFDFPLIKEDYNKRFIIISNNQEDNPELGIKDFELPNLRDYTLNFYHTELQTDFNFNFANENYQLHNGFANYTNPGMGMELKVELQEVFENYQIDGGFRYSLNADYKIGRAHV